MKFLTQLPAALAVAVISMAPGAGFAAGDAIEQLAQAEGALLDEFDGEVLAEHWEILNPNADAFIVEDGNLLVIGSATNALDSGSTENVFRLTQPLPKGDWVATMKFSMDYQTGYEVPFLGVYDSNSDYVTSFAYARSYYEAIRGAQLFLGGQKMAKGEKKDFSRHIWGGASGVPFTSDTAPNPILLRLTKKGRSYIPAVKLEGIEGSEWIEHEKYTVLRQKGNLAFGIYLWQAGTESVMFVDWLKIEPVAK